MWVQLVVTSPTTTWSLILLYISSSGPHKDIDDFVRLHVVVSNIPTCSFDAVSFPSMGRSSLVVDKRQEAPTCSSVAVDCVCVTS